MDCSHPYQELYETIAKENIHSNNHCNYVYPGETVPDTTDEPSENSMTTVKGAMFAEDQFAAVAQTVPLKNIGRPEHVANASLKFQSVLAKNMQQLLRLLKLNLFDKRDLIALLRADPRDGSLPDTDQMKPIRKLTRQQL